MGDNDFLRILRNQVAAIGEDGFNDLLTEMDHPLEQHWRTLDVNDRAELRQAWRKRLRADFDRALSEAVRVAAFPAEERSTWTT